MLTRLSQSNLLQHSKRSITGYLKNALNLHDTNSELYQTARADSTLPLSSHVPHVQEAVDANIQITRLDNGVTVVTETPSFPGTVDINYTLNVGARDELESESGSCLSMKNSYLKTILTTNETINYGMVQMSGGSSSMVYDQETSQYRASCMSHDVVDLFNMVSDCALEPKNVIAANVAIEKNKHAHQLEGVHNTGISFRDNLGRCAYGAGGLGNPMNGIQANVQNLNASTLQKFQIRNITPDRIFVGAAGVENHTEFVDLVANKLSFIQSMNEGHEGSFREQSQYRGGQTMVGCQGNTTDIALCFEGAKWDDQAMLDGLQIATALIGSSNCFSEKIRNASSLRAHNNVTSVHNFVDSFAAINYHFSDSGLWGLRISGQTANGNDMVNILIEELNNLQNNLNEEELNRAKNTLRLKVLLGLERQADRLTETLQNLRTYGRVVHTDYLTALNAVTVAQVQNAVSKALSSKPTYVCHGGDVGGLMSLSEVEDRLR